MSYDYKVQKVSQNDVDKATRVLSDRGAEGWRVIYVTPFSQDLIVILERNGSEPGLEPVPVPKKKVGRPKKTES